MKVGALIIGDEILSGRRQDRHFPQLVQALNRRGMQLSWAQFLGDDPGQITAALSLALRSGDLVFSYGGIGATPDDHTRRCAGLALGEPLHLHPHARELILQRSMLLAEQHGQPLDQDSQEFKNRLEMGMFPSSASLIPNPYNGIPGFACGSVYFVPGFPVMAAPMVDWVLDTHYVHLQHREARIERAVIVRSAMESSLTPMMQALEARYPKIKVFSLPSVDHPTWGRHIELGVKGYRPELDEAYDWLLAQLQALGCDVGPELVQDMHIAPK